MARILTDTLTANGRSNTATIVNPNTGARPEQNVAVFGNFDNGSAALEITYDNGTTWLPVSDGISDVVFDGTAATLSPVVTNVLGGNNPETNDVVKLSVNLTGATSPSITVVITDVR